MIRNNISIGIKTDEICSFCVKFCNVYSCHDCYDTIQYVELVSGTYWSNYNRILGKKIST